MPSMVTSANMMVSFSKLLLTTTSSTEGAAALKEKSIRPGRETGPGRAFLERKPIHIPDVELDPT